MKWGLTADGLLAAWSILIMVLNQALPIVVGISTVIFIWYGIRLRRKKLKELDGTED